MSDSLQPHGLGHARLPCPSPTLGSYSNSCPLSWWCHPTISSSVVPFSWLQSFPASGSFPVILFFTSRGQRSGVSASASVLPMNIQDWFPLGLTSAYMYQISGWPESVFRIFHRLRWKNPKELSGQLNTYACVHVQSLSYVWLFATPWTVAFQVSLSMEFPRQKY